METYIADPPHARSTSRTAELSTWQFVAVVSIITLWCHLMFYSCPSKQLRILTLLKHYLYIHVHYCLISIAALWLVSTAQRSLSRSTQTTLPQTYQCNDSFHQPVILCFRCIYFLPVSEPPRAAEDSPKLTTISCSSVSYCVMMSVTS